MQSSNNFSNFGDKIILEMTFKNIGEKEPKLLEEMYPPQSPGVCITTSNESRKLDVYLDREIFQNNPKN